MVKGEEERFLRDFFRSLSFDPIEDPLRDPRYFRLYEREELAPQDPIDRLATTIRWSQRESAQLFSGFRGTGKSTELRRLRSLLREDPKYHVALCDMKGYLNEAMPLEVSDFLMAVAGALSDQLKDEELLGADPSRESFWARVLRFFRTARVDVEGLNLEAKAAGEAGLADASASLKASLKSDPSFRATLQERMRNHLGAFKQEVHAYVHECLEALRARHGEEGELVLLLDSVEHIRGTSQNYEEVADSVESLFRIHADKLRIEWVHVIYTVPPWLRIKSPGAAQGFDSFQHIHCVKTHSLSGERFEPGFSALVELIESRGQWSRLLGDRATLDRLIDSSGGYIRDLFRLLKEVLRGARELPAGSRAVDLAIAELRNDYATFSNNDALWLERIESTGEADLDDEALLKRLARFFDTHLVLGYRNGGVWYRVHPVVRELVVKRAARYRAREGEE